MAPWPRASTKEKSVGNDRFIAGEAVHWKRSGSTKGCSSFRLKSGVARQSHLPSLRVNIDLINSPGQK
jgi:hypothetical protein